MQVRRRLVSVSLLLASARLLVAGAVAAQEPIDFAHTLLLRRPLMEREVEVQVRRDTGRAGDEAVATIALDVPVLPRWQIEIAVPLIERDRLHAPSEAGLGDLVLGNKFLVAEPVINRALVAAGFDVQLPTGAAGRLGGTVGLTPFAVAGAKAGRFDVLADLAYQWLSPTGRGGHNEQRVLSGVSVFSQASRHVTPFVEVTSITKVAGSDTGTNLRLLGRAQVYVTPGLNIEVAPGRVLLFGVQLPVTAVRTLDWGVRVGAVFDF